MAVPVQAVVMVAVAALALMDRTPIKDTTEVAGVLVEVITAMVVTVVAVIAAIQDAAIAVEVVALEAVMPDRLIHHTLTSADTHRRPQCR